MQHSQMGHESSVGASTGREGKEGGGKKGMGRTGNIWWMFLWVFTSSRFHCDMGKEIVAQGRRLDLTLTFVHSDIGFFQSCFFSVPISVYTLALHPSI